MSRPLWKRLRKSTCQALWRRCRRRWPCPRCADTSRTHQDCQRVPRTGVWGPWAAELGHLLIASTADGTLTGWGGVWTLRNAGADPSLEPCPFLGFFRLPPCMEHTSVCTSHVSGTVPGTEDTTVSDTDHIPGPAEFSYGKGDRLWANSRKDS